MEPLEPLLLPVDVDDVEDVDDVVDEALELGVPVVGVPVDDVVLELVDDVDELLDALPDVAPWLPLVLPAAVAPALEDDALVSVVVFRPQPTQAQQDTTMAMAARFMARF